MKTSKHHLLPALLLLIAVGLGQAARAQVGTFTVTNTSGSTFTITRTSNTDATEKVRYRTVSLSAIAGTHFTATSGELTFDANNNTRTVTVTESGSAANAYKYQTSANRQYRFEVTDLGGGYLAHCNRSISSGLTQFSGAKVSSSVSNLVTMSSGSFSSGMSSSKYLDVSYSIPSSWLTTSGVLNGYVLIDDEYDYAQKPATVSTSTLISSTGAPTSYLSTLGYKIYATVCFTEKEKDDGYQYIQIIAGDASHDYDGADPNGAVNDPSNSVYKVCYELSDGSDQGQGKAYFPHRGTTSSEFSLSDGKLWQQKYKCDNNWDYNGSGAVVLPVTTTNITTRFDAGGNNDDTWGYKDFFVRMALRDATAPTKSGDPVVAPGPYGAGTIVYISVPFSEIVTVSGTPYLHTDWGDYDYFSGSGSNVLTFSGTIPTTFGAQLITRTFNGTITDLAGNALASNNCYKEFSITVALPWGGSGTEADPYVISRADQLDYMATRVNAGYGNDSFNGKYFVLGGDITYSHTIDWNTYSGASSTIENNFTPIGCYGRSFQGHFDGQGHTISGIRVNKPQSGVSDNSNESLGLFGFVSGGSVSNVILRDANIRGLKNMGGIVGYLSGGSVTNCTLYQVLVGSHAKSNMATGMGIVAGYVGGTVTDCYYRDCVRGLTYQDPHTGDITLMPHPERWDNVYTVTTESGVSANYVSGVSVTIDAASYYAEGCTFNLAYSGTIETAKVQDGYTNTYTITEGLHTLTYHDHIDATLTLPAADCSVTVRWASAWTGSGTEEAPYVITTPAQLNLLAKMVNGSGGYGYSDFSGNYFQLGNDIDYSATTDWNDATSTENNYTAIGGWRSGTTYNQFMGDFDGDGHTISGIRIYKPESSTANGYQGLFGYVGTGGSIHDVTLADARITGQLSVGGIVGLSYGSVMNCTVAADVCVASKNTNSHYHAGIVGNNHGTVSGCTSAVTLTAAHTGPDDYGAVVGINYSDGTVENCFAHGATIPAMNDHYGVIAGYNSSGTLTANYYRDCTVGSTANAVGVGCGTSGAPTDVDGARSVHTLTLPDGVTATGESVDISSTTYYAAGTDVTLANPGSAPSGYVEPCYYSLDGTNIVGSTIQMPASDATVALLWTTDYETGHAGTAADPYIISDYPQLEMLASRVNEGNYYSSGKHFKLGADIVCFDGENNHTAIGLNVSDRYFQGTFDGDGHTVSGIRINRSSNCQGLFGYLGGAGPEVKNVTLAGSTITAHTYVGSIVGSSSSGTIENCRVLSDVTIKADASTATSHGGIVGYVSGSTTVNGCVSAATVTRNGKISCLHYGGIVGHLKSGTISNSIAAGAWVIGSEESSSGAIVGTNDGGTLAHNYYCDCGVCNFANNVGTGSGDVTENDGAIRATSIKAIEGYGESTGSDHWAFIASPVAAGSAIGDVHNLVAATATEYDLYRLNPSTMMWENYKNTTDHPDFTTLVNGQGYLYANKEDRYLVFKGTANTDETKTVDLEQGFNLVGNPFVEEAYANRAFYKMNAEGSGIEIVSEYWDNPIDVCTGVVVYAESAGNVTFSTSAPDHSTGGNGSLQLTLAQTVATRDGSDMETLDKAVVSFDEGSQLGKFYFGEQAANIYIPQGGKEYAIASVGSDARFCVSTTEMPINFKALKDGEYSITVAPEGVELGYLHLIDNLTGADVDLLTPPSYGHPLTEGDVPLLKGGQEDSNEPSYKFSAKTTDSESRFKLVFRDEEGLTTSYENFAYLNNGNLVLACDYDNATLQIVDVTGRVIRQENATGQMSVKGIPAGVYVLRLIHNKEMKVQKIVIQ